MNKDRDTEGTIAIIIQLLLVVGWCAALLERAHSLMMGVRSPGTLSLIFVAVLCGMEIYLFQLRLREGK